MRQYIFAALLAASCLAMPANATVIYNNGAPDSYNGNDATQWIQAEDFMFAGGANVAGAGVYLAGVGGVGNWDGAFTYYLFADSAGAPGAVLQSGAVSPTVTDSGTPWCCGGDSYLFGFDFGSTFNAAAGSTYWLGIHASTDFNRDDIYWVTTGLNGTALGQESDLGTMDNWISNSQEHAFYLTDAGAVPEPGTWATMLLGFGMVGAAMRFRRSRRATRMLAA